jgi:acetolactate synthase I/II/III large subunit
LKEGKMAVVTPGQLIVRILKEEGVTFFCGIHGGHLWPMQLALAEGGLKMYHLRHEQTGPYISDGWGRVTGRPGVCFGTAGPGMYNMVPGLAHSFLCNSPVVAIAGQHETTRDGWGPFQEGYAVEVCKSFTKWCKRIVDPRTVAYHLQKALRDSVTYPAGPVLLEIPVNILGRKHEDATQIGYLPAKSSAEIGEPGADPALIEKAVRMLLEAERPVIIGGNGIYWSRASEVLKEFVEMARIPVHTRRMGRGAVPENHPLAFSGGYRRPLLNQADVVVVFGLRMNMLEHFGQPPTYSHKAKYILVSESMEELDARMPTEMRLLANPRVVLKQMIDCAKDLMKSPPDRTAWLAEITKAKEAAAKQKKALVEKGRGAKPINPHFLAQEAIDFLDDSATIILDSYSMAGFSTDKIEAKFAGQVLDAGTDGGVGHSVGMAMGAQLGRPGRQVLALLGDGGLGVTGFDIETAARYHIPAVYLLFNNSGWISTEFQKIALPGVDSWGMLPDIRYDKMFAEVSCHTELVTEPEQIRPALERSFNSGKTSLINVIPDNTILPPQTQASMNRGRE